MPVFCGPRCRRFGLDCVPCCLWLGRLVYLYHVCACVHRLLRGVRGGILVWLALFIASLRVTSRLLSQ
jgi:hypothetical protein